MAEKEVCIGCGHDIGMHFNDVTGKARCLIMFRRVTTSGVIGLEYDEQCKCLDFQCPHPAYIPHVDEETIERLKAAFAANP